MPELPEVETIVNDLNQSVLNKRIKKVNILLPKIVKGSNSCFINTLKNNSFQNIIRRGKYIIFSLKNNKFLVIHLRMTGQIIYKQKDNLIAGGHSDQNNNFNLPNKQTHVIIYFNDGPQLFYNDQRQFGYLEIINQEGLKQIDDKLGIEPLSEQFTLKCFKDLLKNSKRNIKAFLLDQKHVAGLGNIYVDESLFLAHILPTRSLNTLNEKEIKDLYQAIKKVLRLAIKYRGTTFNNYKDAHGRKGSFINRLKVYGQENRKCLRCRKGVIKKIRTAGRGTRYCFYCQK
jgi:formamidopyrimidine-DNA glycosylase